MKLPEKIYVDNNIFPTHIDLCGFSINKKE